MCMVKDKVTLSAYTTSQNSDCVISHTQDNRYCMNRVNSQELRRNTQKH